MKLQPKDKQEILEKAIRKALAGGWKHQWLEAQNFNLILGDTLYPVDPSKLWSFHVNEIVFNHDFAEALWGDPWAYFTDGTSGDTISGGFINYKGHLANMVVAEDAIEYLGKNV